MDLGDDALRVAGGAGRREFAATWTADVRSTAELLSLLVSKRSGQMHLSAPAQLPQGAVTALHQWWTKTTKCSPPRTSAGTRRGGRPLRRRHRHPVSAVGGRTVHGPTLTVRVGRVPRMDRSSETPSPSVRRRGACLGFFCRNAADCPSLARHQALWLPTMPARRGRHRSRHGPPHPQCHTHPLQ